MAPITTTAQPARANVQSTPVRTAVQQPSARQTERTPAARSENKPGFFRRIINWFKNLFSRRRRNTETANGDAGQMYTDTMANVSDISNMPRTSEITDTLPPAVTEEAVQEIAEEIIETPQTPEQPVFSGGGMNAEILQSDKGAYISKGTVKVFGKDVEWESYAPVFLEGSSAANIKIGSADKDIFIDGLSVSLKDDGVSYSFNDKTEIHVRVDEIDFAFFAEGEKDSLDEIKSKRAEAVVKIDNADTLLQYGTEFTYSAAGLFFEGAPEAEITTLPREAKLFHADATSVKVRLQKDDKLRTMLSFDDNQPDFKKGILTVQFYNSAKVETELLRSGSVENTLSDPTFAVYLFKFEKPIYSNAVGGKKLSKNGSEYTIEVASVELGDYKINTLSLSLDFTAGSARINKIGSIESTKLEKKLEVNARAENTESGISIKSAAINYELDDFGKKMTANFSITNAVFDTQKGLTFDSAEAVLKDVKMFENNLLILDELRLSASRFDADGLKFSLQVTNLHMNYSSKLLSVEMHSQSTNISYDPTANNTAAGTAGGDANADNSILNKLTGSINGSVKIYFLPEFFNSESAVSVEMSDISIAQGKLSFPQIEVGVDLSMLEDYIEDLSGTVNFTAKNLAFTSAGHTVESFQMRMTQIKYGDKELTDEEALEFKDAEDGNPEKAVINLKKEDHYILGDKDSEGFLKFSDAQLIVTTANSKFNFGFGGTVSAKKSGFEFTAEKANYCINSREMNIEKVSATNTELNETLSSLTSKKVSGLAFELSDIAYKQGNFTIGKVGLAAELDIPVTDNFKITKAGLNYDLEKNIILLSGGISYENEDSFIKSAEGKGTVKYENGKLSIDSFEEVKAQIGSFSGNVEKVEFQDYRNFTFKKIGLGYVKEENKDISKENEFLKNIPFISKLAGFIKEAEISLDELTFTDSKPKLPQPGEINLEKFLGEAKISDNLSFGIGLDKPAKVDEASIDLWLQGKFGIPYKESDRKKIPGVTLVNLFSVNFNFPIVPLVSATIGLRGGAMAEAGIDLKTSISPNTKESKVAAELHLDSGISASVGIGVVAGLLIGTDKLGGFGGFFANARAEMSGNFNCDLNAVIDTNQKSFAKMISVDSSQFAFDLSGKLSLSFGATVEANAPVIFEGGKKAFTFTFKTIDIAKATVNTVGVYRNGEFTYSEKSSFTPNLADEKERKYYEKVNLQLDKLNKDEQTLKDMYETFKDIKDKLKNGDKRVVIGGNELLDKVGKRQLKLYYKKISESLESEKSLYELINNESDYIDRRAEESFNIRKEASYINYIADQSKSGLEFIEREAQTNSKDEKADSVLTLAKQVEVFYNLLKGNKIDEDSPLVGMDPVAFLNLMEAYKYSGHFLNFSGFHWYGIAKKMSGDSKKMEKLVKESGKLPDVGAAFEDLRKKFEEANEEADKNKDGIKTLSGEKFNLSSAYLGVRETYKAMSSRFEEIYSKAVGEQTWARQDENSKPIKALLVKCVLLYLVLSYYSPKDVDKIKGIISLTDFEKKDFEPAPLDTSNIPKEVLDKKAKDKETLDKKIQDVDKTVASKLATVKPLILDAERKAAFEGNAESAIKGMQKISNAAANGDLPANALVGTTLSKALNIESFNDNLNEKLKGNTNILNKHKSLLDSVHKFDLQAEASMKQFEQLRNQVCGVESTVSVYLEKADKMQEIFKDMNKSIDEKLSFIKENLPEKENK